MESSEKIAELARICARQARMTTTADAARALWELALRYQRQAAELDSGTLPDIGDPPPFIPD